MAEAFVPGHVSGFVTVDRDEDPTVAGSRGVGLALSEGVTVSVREAGERSVRLNGSPAGMEAVERVLDALDATAAVRGETDLPVGAGLGVSGAMALGAALAAAAALDRPLSVDELVTVAHGAEVQAGTGLGDVVGQARGGVPIRLEPGGPHENAVDEVPAPRSTRVEYLVLDERVEPTDRDGAALTAAGERALSALVREPTLPTAMEASRRFAREADLLTEEARGVIEDVAAAGGSGAAGVPGRVVLALGGGLSEAGYDPEVCRLHPGAGLR